MCRKAELGSAPPNSLRKMPTVAKELAEFNNGLIEKRASDASIKTWRTNQSFNYRNKFPPNGPKTLAYRIDSKPTIQALRKFYLSPPYHEISLDLTSCVCPLCQDSSSLSILPFFPASSAPCVLELSEVSLECFSHWSAFAYWGVLHVNSTSFFPSFLAFRLPVGGLPGLVWRTVSKKERNAGPQAGQHLDTTI